MTTSNPSAENDSESGLWTTPTVRDASGPSFAKKARNGQELATQVEAQTTSGRFWPTPKEQDFRSAQGESKLRRNTPDLHVAVVQISPVSTSSPAASPASPLAPQASAKAQPMTAISGRNLRELFDVPDRVGAFLRTCRESSVWRVGLTEYSLTWIRSATPQGRSLFRLRLSAPTTAGIGSGLWPTPREQTVTGPSQTDTREGGADLQTAVLFGTPMANNKVRSEEFAAGRTPNLREVEKDAITMLPTPTVQDGENTAGPSTFERNSLPLNAVAANGTPGMKLSAAWVTRLMGYPDGWMDDLPSDPTGKPASPASRSTRSTA